MREQPPEIMTEGERLSVLANELLRKRLEQEAADAKLQETAQKHRAYLKKHWPKGLLGLAAISSILLFKSYTGQHPTPEEALPTSTASSQSVPAQEPTIRSIPQTSTSEQATIPPIPEVDRTTTVSIHDAWGIKNNDYTCDQLLGSVGLSCSTETQTWFNESTEAIEDFTARREFNVISAMPPGHEPVDRATVSIVACSEMMAGTNIHEASAKLTELWQVPEFNADSLAYLSLTKVCPQFQ